MTFEWPEALLMLFALPLLVAGYLYLLRRKKRQALRYSSLGLVKAAIGAAPSWRRHVPPALLLAALAAMIVAVARPAAFVTLPANNETVILAMDVSGSMRATDVEPTRLAAAQAAAKQFIAEVPQSVKIGIVAFAGTATVAQAPTRNKEDLVAAIDRFQLQRATAIGSAIIVSMATLFPDGGYDVSSFIYERQSQRLPPKASYRPMPPGSYASAVIILLTDGQRTAGPDSLEAARLAADRGVRIYTVGIGTPQGSIVGIEGWSMRVRLDEETLKGIADLTRGEYFYAGSAPDLKSVYRNLNSRFVLETKKTEIGALFTAAAAALVVLAAGLSLAWFGRIL
jgi:Ca-activated chloride channel family protein